jgi:hypothetical protein
MPREGFDYEATYSTMADEELLSLACSSDTFADAAQAALQRESDKRKLKLEAATRMQPEIELAGPVI